MRSPHLETRCLVATTPSRRNPTSAQGYVLLSTPSSCARNLRGPVAAWVITVRARSLHYIRVTSMQPHLCAQPHTTPDAARLIAARARSLHLKTHISRRIPSSARNPTDPVAAWIVAGGRAAYITDASPRRNPPSHRSPTSSRHPTTPVAAWLIGGRVMRASKTHHPHRSLASAQAASQGLRCNEGAQPTPPDAPSRRSPTSARNPITPCERLWPDLGSSRYRVFEVPSGLWMI